MGWRELLEVPERNQTDRAESAQSQEIGNCADIADIALKVVEDADTPQPTMPVPAIPRRPVIRFKLIEGGGTLLGVLGDDPEQLIQSLRDRFGCQFVSATGD